MNTNLSLYRIFCSVAEHKNISKAASELYISQPAISKAIQKLEQNLGVTLFHRNSRGVLLTAEGELLYQQVLFAFQALQKGEEDLKKIHELGIGQLRIGVSTSLCKYLLLPYLKSFLERYPHVKITIDCQSSLHTIKLLEERKIDIGLVGKPKHLRQLTFQPVAQLTDVFVATQTYLDNLKVRSMDTKTDFIKQGNVMLLDGENLTRQYINEYLQANKIEPNQVLEVNNMDLLIDFAKIGIGIACVIKEFVQAELDTGLLTELKLNSLIPKREVGFAYDASSFMTQTMKWFLDHVNEHQ
ncbi:LysR family transcriptional regulator [Anaeromicropila populeti]|uniref:Transcriptional regulator, LysR family n=1 Tax=Anaeromicropila populeti TaxID=37658 RepID=A0A1I6ISB1_9FIRM|nr:LysR family transcriptional regulator [Anaeromicropila populeti]SFR69636.1 transcriptional regulator, LysR family [Anaeromicropila populeti]